MFWTCAGSERCEHAANILNKIPQRQIQVTKGGEGVVFPIFLEKDNISTSTTAPILGRDCTNFCHCAMNLLLTYFWGAKFVFSMKYLLTVLTLFTGTALLIAAVPPHALDHSWNYPPNSHFTAGESFHLHNGASTNRCFDPPSLVNGRLRHSGSPLGRISMRDANAASSTRSFHHKDSAL